MGVFQILQKLPLNFLIHLYLIVIIEIQYSSLDRSSAENNDFKVKSCVNDCVLHMIKPNILVADVAVSTCLLKDKELSNVIHSVRSAQHSVANFIVNY